MYRDRVKRPREDVCRAQSIRQNHSRATRVESLLMVNSGQNTKMIGMGIQISENPMLKHAHLRGATNTKSGGD